MTRSMGELVAKDINGKVLAVFKPRGSKMAVDKELVKICPLCGATLAKLSRDHFWPRYLGADSFFYGKANFWRICEQCNISKDRRMPTTEQTIAFSIAKGFCKL